MSEEQKWYELTEGMKESDRIKMEANVKENPEDIKDPPMFQGFSGKMQDLGGVIFMKIRKAHNKNLAQHGIMSPINLNPWLIMEKVRSDQAMWKVIRL